MDNLRKQPTFGDATTGHLAGKPVIALPNVGRFLRLINGRSRFKFCVYACKIYVRTHVKIPRQWKTTLTDVSDL